MILTNDQDKALCAINNWFQSDAKFFYLAG